MFELSLLLCCKFILLFMFCLINHSVYYCVLLVLNSLVCGLICYLVYGFRWYSLLFCLVYVGGVYILFVFVSVYNPKNKLISYYNFSHLVMFLLLFILGCVGRFILYSVNRFEFSEYLCTSVEGWFYLCMCMTLVFGFVVLRMIMSVNLNYYR